MITVITIEIGSSSNIVTATLLISSAITELTIAGSNTPITIQAKP